VLDKRNSGVLIATLRVIQARASLRLRSPGSGFAEDLRKLLDCCCRISAKGRWKTLDAAVSIEDLATLLP